MIDRLVHHAEILALKGDSYRLKDRDLARSAPPATDPRGERRSGADLRVAHFSTGARGPYFHPALTPRLQAGGARDRQMTR
jgi:hypothetical protein